MIIQRVPNKLGVWDHMHNIIESKKRRAFCEIIQCVEVLLLGHIRAACIYCNSYGCTSTYCNELNGIMSTKELL